jgi:hypothetical protein
MKSHDVEVHDEDPGSASAVLYEPWWTPSLGMYIRVVRFYFDDRDLLRCFDESGGTRDAAPKWTTCD